MHAQGHRQQADQDAELFAQQRPGQRHARSNGEHAARALGPSDRPERVAGPARPPRSAVVDVDIG
jgi:hypothetical protein